MIVLAVARQQACQDAAGLRRLLASEIVQRNVAGSLQPSFRVPRRLAMADVVDRGARH